MILRLAALALVSSIAVAHADDARVPLMTVPATPDAVYIRADGGCYKKLNDTMQVRVRVTGRGGSRTNSSAMAVDPNELVTLLTGTPPCP